MSDKEIIKLEYVKRYYLNNGKYGKFIRVETDEVGAVEVVGPTQTEPVTPTFTADAVFGIYFSLLFRLSQGLG